jgi:hypothetical protein
MPDRTAVDRGDGARRAVAIHCRLSLGDVRLHVSIVGRPCSGGAGGEHSLGGGRASLRWLLRIDRHYIGTNGQNLMTHAGFFCYRAKRIGH